MRVVAGEKGGLQLKAVPGKQTRPTTDKVKEAIFNMVGPFFADGSCLDLYAGSGGLGIEALSRGIKSCVFVDSQKQAIETIHANLAHTSLQDQSSVYRNDSMRALKALIKREATFSLIFLDPPYAKAEQQLKTGLALISDYDLLQVGGTIVCETGAVTTLPIDIGGLLKVRDELYGDTRISLYERRSSR
ncbi:16S rRNA (guanine(966)-N(2))-methyltransferase RsmD [Shouchella patagoniensis]|uniref:16S rRNA (guanine(966)-N(2))-methyltransferase RsmD n=1 Tax=Shouchella patagoniensis TaxID=228576 RepID=UPI000995160B|nr:16S rRNA (guanine(966)-N(2))-methyltransferase RsmD [Shouchella patagoniensis]